MNRKVLRSRIDLIIRAIVVLGFSAIILYSIERPPSEWIFWFTLTVTSLAVIGIAVEVNPRIKDRLITRVWRKLNRGI